MKKRKSLIIGCSQMGSISSKYSKYDYINTLKTAHSEDITYYDTAPSYGQGDSEKILGKIFRGLDNIYITTKTGYFITPQYKFLFQFKFIIKFLLRLIDTKSNSSVKGGITNLRKNGNYLYKSFTKKSLTKSLISSLKRLKRKNVYIFLLHDPETKDITNHEIIDTLTDLKSRKYFKYAGVSINTIEEFYEAIKFSIYEVIQIPYKLYKQLDENNFEFPSDKKIQVRGLLFFNGYFDTAILSKLLNNEKLQCLIGVSQEKHLKDILKKIDD